MCAEFEEGPISDDEHSFGPVGRVRPGVRHPVLRPGRVGPVRSSKPSMKACGEAGQAAVADSGGLSQEVEPSLGSHRRSVRDVLPSPFPCTKKPWPRQASADILRVQLPGSGAVGFIFTPARASAHRVFHANNGFSAVSHR